jgi:DNA-binding NtrC family response regulator
LRERTSEIPALASGFLAQSADRNGIPQSPGLTSEALAMLCEYSWPGNIRELRNVMERASLLCGGGVVDLEHLPMEKMRPSALAVPEIEPTPARAAESAPATADSGHERGRIVEALERAGGNQTEAARLLGISRRTLINRVIHFNIPRPRKK